MPLNKETKPSLIMVNSLTYITPPEVPAKWYIAIVGSIVLLVELYSHDEK